MKSIFSLGIFLYLIISSTCADDCSAKTTEAACTGSCKWKAGTEATCKTTATCTLKIDKSGCTSSEGCTYTSSETITTKCISACAEGDSKAHCEDAGFEYDDTDDTCSPATCSKGITRYATRSGN